MDPKGKDFSSQGLGSVVFDCRYFSGYRPCQKIPESSLSNLSSCTPNCHHKDVPKVSILIVHLGALGAVLRSTALLPAIKRKYPSSFIVWVTEAQARPLLKNLSQVDRVFSRSQEDILCLKALEFDAALVFDKTLEATSLVAQTGGVGEIFGFQSHPKTGAIFPANPQAYELWRLGLDNHYKFYENQKTELQVLHEAMDLGPYTRDEYQVELTEDEKKIAANRRREWTRDANQIVVGINTGSSPLWTTKAWPIDYQKNLLKTLFSNGYTNLVLLGGPEDVERNQKIGFGLKVVVQSPTNGGLRDGLSSVEACDVIITGDSLGLHMGVGLKKWVVAWFGPTCAHEIELYGRGVKLKTPATCSPCWKRNCQNQPMCYDLIPEEEVLQALDTIRDEIRKKALPSIARSA